jgi:hypothetical protein
VQYLFGDLLKDCTELKAETVSSACFMNDGTGNFTRKDLPSALQIAPIFTFTSFSTGNTKRFFAAGNFYGVAPYEGRYDALNPTFFGYDKNSNQLHYLSELPAIDGECRDAKWISYAGGGKILILALNNAQLVFLKPAL